MSKLRIYLCALLFVGLFGVDFEAVAQYRKIHKKSIIRRVEKYSCPVVKQFKARQGIGLKVGDPIGVTYKLYFLKRFAFELVVGQTTSGLYTNFIRDNFNLDPDNSEFTYIGHKINISPSVQGRMLVHNPLPAGITGEVGIDWYFGIGFNLKTLKVDFTFEEGNDPADFQIGSLEETYTLTGPEGVLGFEYILPNSPLSAFAEAGVFIDLKNENSKPRFQGGLGVRYNF